MRKQGMFRTSVSRRISDVVRLKWTRTTTRDDLLVKGEKVGKFNTCTLKPDKIKKVSIDVDTSGKITSFVVEFH